MTIEAKLMLEKLYEVFTNQFHDPVKSWDRFIEFIATDHNAGLPQQLDHKFEWLLQNQDFLERVSKTYDPKVLRSSCEDDLGSLFHARVAGTRADTRNIGCSQLEDIARTDRQITVLDTAVGTGARLLAVHRSNPKAVLFGTDPDLRAVRIAITNAAIHGIPVLLLHADYRIHDLALGTVNGRTNWQYANNWYSSMDKLRKLPQRGRMPRNQRHNVGRRTTNDQ